MLMYIDQLFVLNVALAVALGIIIVATLRVLAGLLISVLALLFMGTVALFTAKKRRRLNFGYRS